jgi:hypothetical protein
MQAVSTIGLDIAKSVFQVHGVDAAGQVVIRRKETIGRRPPPSLQVIAAPVQCDVDGIPKGSHFVIVAA